MFGSLGVFIMSNNTSSTASKHQEVIQFQSGQNWSERQIKVLASQDPKRAMNIVIVKYRSCLLRIANRIVYDIDEAYDIVQNTFIKAIGEKRFFDEDFYIKAWLCRVVTNSCYNATRNKKRRKEILHQNKIDDRTEANQLEDMEINEEQKMVHMALQTLNETHRQILELRYFEHMSYQEIATILNVPIGTVMSRISRAKIALQESVLSS